MVAKKDGLAIDEGNGNVGSLRYRSEPKVRKKVIIWQYRGTSGFSIYLF